MKVSDIMTGEVITVNKGTSLKDAAGILAKFRIHGMPVVDSNNKVVGILTESDFFTKDSSNIYLPTFLDFIKSEPKPDEDGANTDLEKITRVVDIMTEKCLTVKPSSARLGIKNASRKNKTGIYGYGNGTKRNFCVSRTTLRIRSFCATLKSKPS